MSRYAGGKTLVFMEPKEEGSVSVLGEGGRMRRQIAERCPTDRRKVWPLQGFEAGGTAGLSFPEDFTLGEEEHMWEASGSDYPLPLTPT